MELNDLVDLARPYTGMRREGLNKLYKFVAGHELPDGAVAQCGATNGGSAVLLWHACQASLGLRDVKYYVSTIEERDLWMFDSWEGLPPPTEEDGGKAGSKYEYHMAVHGSWCKGQVEKAREIARLGGVPVNRTHCVRGWFEDTLPIWAEKVGTIAMLHLDADWYRSTLTCLEYLYPRVAEGGLVMLDDYGYWQGTDAACREYGIEELLTATPPCGAWMVKKKDSMRMAAREYSGRMGELHE